MIAKSFHRILPLALLFLCTAAAQAAAPQKVKVCHLPPGNPGNFHTITIAASALPAHLAHGDFPGACAQFCDRLCDDGNPCTIDACDANEQCVLAHPPVNCNDGNRCTTDSCNPASGCVSAPIACTDGDNCTINACDPLTGTCVAPPVECPAGQSCDPANGNCVGTDPCVPNPCANGTCAPAGGGCLSGITCTPAADFTCTCAPGWTGELCDIPADPCAGVTCPSRYSYDCRVGSCANGVCDYSIFRPDGSYCYLSFPGENSSCQGGVCFRGLEY